MFDDKLVCAPWTSQIAHKDPGTRSGKSILRTTQLSRRFTRVNWLQACQNCRKMCLGDWRSTYSGFRAGVTSTPLWPAAPFTVHCWWIGQLRSDGHNEVPLTSSVSSKYILYIDRRFGTDLASWRSTKTRHRLQKPSWRATTVLMMKPWGDEFWNVSSCSFKQMLCQWLSNCKII